MKESERILALREKLMSPAKTRDSAETLKRHQAKLAKAERNRERLLEAKYNRYVELSERVIVLTLPGLVHYHHLGITFFLVSNVK